MSSTPLLTCYRQRIQKAGEYHCKNLAKTPWNYQLPWNHFPFSALLQALVKSVTNERKCVTKFRFVNAKDICFNFCFAEHKFASAGREDVDVRMLGRGKLAVHTDCGRIRKAIFCCCCCCFG